MKKAINWTRSQRLWSYFQEMENQAVMLNINKWHSHVLFRKICATRILLLLVAFLWQPFHLEAADWRLIPKIGLSGGYNDNITFTKEDKIDSSIY